MLSSKKFKQLVQKGIDEIPERFLKKLDNVVIVIEDTPDAFQRRKIRLRKDQVLFGLYEGIPQIKRRNYSGVLPDKITIFKKAIEAVARKEKDIKEMVKQTVWHEIAHHFGMNEKEVRQAQVKKKRRETFNKKR